MTNERRGLAYIDGDGRIFWMRDGSDEENNISDIEIYRREIRALVNAYSDYTTERSPYKAFSDLLFDKSQWNEAKIKNFCFGRLVAAPSDIGQLIEKIHQIVPNKETAKISPDEFNKLLSRSAPTIASPFKSTRGRSVRNIAIPFDEELEDQQAFSEEYKGPYFVIRMHGDKEISISRMIIGRSYINDISRFQTDRHTRGSDSKIRTVKGIIYRTEGLVFAIGRVSQRHHLRMSIIRRYKRRDLYGIRLGVTPDESTAFAKKIYVARCPKDIDDHDESAMAYTGIFQVSEFENNVRKMKRNNFLESEFSLEEVQTLISGRQLAPSPTTTRILETE